MVYDFSMSRLKHLSVLLHPGHLFMPNMFPHSSILSIDISHSSISLLWSAWATHTVPLLYPGRLALSGSVAVNVHFVFTGLCKLTSFLYHFLLFQVVHFKYILNLFHTLSSHCIKLQTSLMTPKFWQPKKDLNLGHLHVIVERFTS